MKKKIEKIIISAKLKVIKCILLLVVLLSVTNAFGQTGLSSNKNYIYTKNCLNEDCSKKTEAVQYTDDLGKTTQTIAIQATPNGKDIVTPFEYDVFGRQVKSYMPIPQSGTQNGGFYNNPKDNAAQSYGTDLNFFSYTELENSPSAKVLSTTKPGNDIQGRSTKFGYEVNNSTDVKKYIVTTSWNYKATQNKISTDGNYPAGVLLKTSTTDEDGNISIEFTNGKGHTVLARKVINTNQNSDTYYVYNKYGQLVYVIPPLAINEPLNQTTLDNFCYQYKYDSKGRQVEKKLPGKGWEYSVYDKLGRLLMYQDANMGISNQWLFYKYDSFGRTIYTGIFTSSQYYSSQGREYEQSIVNSATTYHEARNTGGFNANGITAYYSNSVYPIAFTKILSVNYYDTYPQGSPERPSQILGKITIGDNMAQTINTKNLSTASLAKNIEDDNWTKNYIWYDEKARPIGTFSENHLSGYTKTETLLDFAGIPQQTKTYHKRVSAYTENIITQNYEYDQHNRLKKHYHQVNSQPQELLSENTYNELSQLSNKKVGNNLQSINYTYNIRGALLKINDPTNLGNSLFSYELKYYNPANTVAGKKTNNVAEVLWKTAADHVLRKYNYQYDALNRLTSGTFSEPEVSVPQNGFYNESVTYDLGGNIQSLQRNGNNGLNNVALIDNLTYNYTGNKLNSVTDNSGNYIGYPDTSGNIISYDANGNMKNHIDKGILQIDYNILNLPNYVKFDKSFLPRPGGSGMTLDYNVNTKYQYRSDGLKIRKIYTYGAGKANYETSLITDYLDGFQYEYFDTGDLFATASLKFVPTAEGYYNFENNKYIYNYTDHLGNIRLSYSKNVNGSAEVLEENNFYPFGLKHEGYNQFVGNPSYNYGYGQKELQKETGWSDFGARMYMADIGRWGIIDPLAETTTRVNPYNYALNNPMMFIDPDGRKALAINNEVFGSENLAMLRRHSQMMYASFWDFLGNDYPVFSSSNSSGGGGGGSSTFGETQEYQNLMAAYWGQRFANALFGEGNDTGESLEQNCCPDLALKVVEGTKISAGIGVSALAVAFNLAFSSAHIPDYAGKKYLYSNLGSGTFTFAQVKAEAKSYPVRERMGQVGSYTILFDGGFKYHGKGPIDRMFTSALLQMTYHSTTVKGFDWRPSVSDREAFKAEYRRMQTDKIPNVYEQGYRNPINYNIRQSPGYLYLLQDGY